MAVDDANRERLFAALVSQMGFATRDALAVALRAWSAARGEKTLGRVLVEQGIVTEVERGVLEDVAKAHLARHGGDPRRSLASLSSDRGAETELVAGAINGRTPRTGDDHDHVPTLELDTPGPPGQRFRVVRHHDRGGMSDVWVAHDDEIHREVALKELQARFVDDHQTRARFLLEAEITGSLEHPGIVPIYGRGQYPDGRPYYAMRLIKGESLKAAVLRLHSAPCESERQPGEWNLEFRRLLRRFLVVCDAIDYAHSRGILHRDLKPDNIMLGAYGEALVVDWGLAKRLGRIGPVERPEPRPRPSPSPSPTGSSDDLEPTVMGRVFGTWSYMSPEQAAGRVDLLGPVSDVYSLGATLYHLLTGRSPFRGIPKIAMLALIQLGKFPPPREINPDVPVALEAICLKAMAPKADDRHPSAKALAADLEHWLDDEPVAAYRAAVAFHERRARENPGRVKDFEALARIHSNLGNALHFLGRNAEAEVAHRTALAEFQALVERNPRGAEPRERLAVAYSNLAWVLRALGRKDEADDAYNASLGEYKGLTSRSLLGRTAADPGLTALFVSQGWPSDPDADPDADGPSPDEGPRPIGTHPAPNRHAGAGAGPSPLPRAPDDFATYFERGKKAYKDGDHAQAIAEYTAAVRIDPTFGEVYNRRGNAYHDQGDADAAIGDYSRAIRLDPDDPILYYNRGKAHDTKGAHAAAIADYTEAIRIDPQFTKAHIRRSKAYNALDR